MNKLTSLLAMVALGASVTAVGCGGDDDDAHLNQGHRQRGDGDDAEEDEPPIGHNVSGVPGACGVAARAWL